MTTKVWFDAMRAGHWEIACAELCGLGHYRMKGFVTAEPQEEFDKWIAEQNAAIAAAAAPAAAAPAAGPPAVSPTPEPQPAPSAMPPAAAKPAPGVTPPAAGQEAKSSS